MADPEEDEWEYEYDEDETEDFYITLDLSNAAPPAGNKHCAVDSQFPSVKVGGRRAIRPTAQGNGANGSTQGDNEQLSQNGQSTNSNEDSRIQIVRLHTSNPLVNYDGWLLSCEWASEIGTGMFFSTAPGSEQDNTEPLHSLPNSIDLLGISAAKLTAYTAKMSEEDAPADNSPEGVARATEVRANASAESSTTLQSRKQEMQKKQVNFLTRLKAAKEKRGETANVPLTVVRRRKVPGHEQPWVPGSDPLFGPYRDKEKTGRSDMDLQPDEAVRREATSHLNGSQDVDMTDAPAEAQT